MRCPKAKRLATLLQMGVFAKTPLVSCDMVGLSNLMFTRIPLYISFFVPLACVKLSLKDYLRRNSTWWVRFSLARVWVLLGLHDYVGSDFIVRPCPLGIISGPWLVGLNFLLELLIPRSPPLRRLYPHISLLSELASFLSSMFLECFVPSLVSLGPLLHSALPEMAPSPPLYLCVCVCLMRPLYTQPPPLP